MKHKKVPVRRTEYVKKLFIMSVLFRLIEHMIKLVRLTVLPKYHLANIKQLQHEQEEQLSLTLAS